MFECDIVHRRSVEVLFICGTLTCILMITCIPMHPFYGAVCASASYTRCVAHRNTYVPSRCKTSHYRMRFIPLSASLWNDLADPVLDGVGLADLKSRANAFF